MPTPLLHLAKDFAHRAHKDQFRRDGVTPYILHPAAVAAKVAHLGEQYESVAWLHDVLEDSDETPASMHAYGFPESVIMSVVALTKTDEPYDEYLRVIRNDRVASAVKVADMLHNLSDNPTPKQIVKYARGLLFLLNASEAKT